MLKNQEYSCASTAFGYGMQHVFPQPKHASIKSLNKKQSLWASPGQSPPFTGVVPDMGVGLYPRSIVLELSRILHSIWQDC